jgi:hypothetical protein
MSWGGSTSRNCLCVYELGTAAPKIAAPVIDATLFAAQ